MSKIFQPVAEQHINILALWEQSVRASHHFLQETDIYAYRELLLLALPELDLYCYAEYGELVGFIAISEDMVQALFIHPDWFGKGIGKKLMQFAVFEKEITKVDVNEQNAKARTFYEGLGFSISSRSEQDGMGKPYPLLHLELDPRDHINYL